MKFCLIFSDFNVDLTLTNTAQSEIKHLVLSLIVRAVIFEILEYVGHLPVLLNVSFDLKTDLSSFKF